jgi:hypothetical protein
MKLKRPDGLERGNEPLPDAPRKVLYLSARQSLEWHRVDYRSAIRQAFRISQRPSIVGKTFSSVGAEAAATALRTISPQA